MPQPCEPIHIGEFLLEERRFPAVYFLYHKGQVVYVGQSRNLTSRIGDHISQAVKRFDAVAFAPCPFNRLTAIERHYIRALAPKYNRCGAAKKAKERETWERLEANRRPFSRSPFHGTSFAPDDEIKFVDAADVIIGPKDFGDFLQICESDAVKFQASPDLKSNSLLDVLYFVADNSKLVSEAQDKFDRL
jgi:predicted GIY-YIG superfamily endonuclease